MEPVAAVNTIIQARLAYLRSLDSWEDFGNGWSRRVERVRAAAVAMAGG